MGSNKEIDKNEFVEIGNHSHSHEYLADENKELILADIKTSISILRKNWKKFPFFLSVWRI